MLRRGHTRAQDLVVVERRAYVMRLRQAGATFVDIQRTIAADPTWHGRLPKSYTERHVHHDVMRELQRTRTELAELVDEVRQMELARLDRLHLAYWPRAIGDPQRQVPGDLSAAQFILQLMARRAKYLPGLEMPENTVDLTVIIQQTVQKVADEFGLTPEEVLAEATLLLASVTNGTHPPLISQ